MDLTTYTPALRDLLTDQPELVTVFNRGPVTTPAAIARMELALRVLERDGFTPDAAVEGYAAQRLYEEFYCARGEMENRIKEAQLDLFADRLSTETFRANQLRLWLSSAAYVLMHALRRIGLAGTELARACANTIRLKLLKIGAVVKVSVRRVKLAMSESYPNQEEFTAAFRQLAAAAR